MKNIMKKIALTILTMCIINTYILALPAFADTNVQTGTLKRYAITVPAGTSFTAKMQTTVSSAELKAGDNIAAVLSENWIYQGTLIAPAGSILYGNVTQVEQAGRGYKNGEFELRFNEIITPDGQSIPIASNTYALGVDENRPLKIASNVGKTTLAGVLAGGLIGDDNKDVLIGAGLGLLAGALSTISQHGNNVELPRNTLIKVKLSHQIIVNVYG